MPNPPSGPYSNVPDILPAAGVIGTGIDVRKTRFPLNRPVIFDLGPLQKYVAPPPNGKTYLKPDGVDVLLGASQHVTAVVADNSYDYQREYSGSLGLSGNYEGFSAEFDASFSYSENRFQSTFYASRTCLMQAWGLKLNQSAQANSVTLAAIRKLAGEGKWDDVFDKFGTHYVATAAVGGQFSIVSSIQKSSSLTISSVTAALEARYEMFFTASASFDTGRLDESWEKNAIKNMSWSGGPAEKVAAARTSPAAFAEWLKSTPVEPVLINYALNPILDATPRPPITDRALVPIWELLPEPARSAGKKAFEDSLLKEMVPFSAIGAANKGSTHNYGRLEVNGTNYFPANPKAPSLSVAVFDLKGDFKNALLQKSYDLYNHPDQAALMIADLARYRVGDYLVMVASGDSGWNGGSLDGGLVDILAQFGADVGQLEGNQDRREPFVLIGRGTPLDDDPTKGGAGSPGRGLSLRGPNEGSSVAISGVLLRGASEEVSRIVINTIVAP